MPTLALILFYKNKREYDPERKSAFMEFFAGLKNTPWARLFTASLLVRRVLFVGVVIFMARNVDRTIIYISLIAFQLIYFSLIVSSISFIF